uniref:NADH dehydrogenase subunit 3 n=1 Tax=Polypylis sp. TS-2018 TaxID=2483258 RepID=UPI002A7F83B2|nr:NADH dehydrogenase subunit 3 [Polypylis sp. TS-2018]WOZ13960.1 NADH dehydrogenase subunit 3 [Polypylis sp. TS-2018]
MLQVMLLSFMLSIIMFLMYLFINYSDYNSNEKKSAFECGFEPLSEMRMPFSMRFFILIILFLIFDIEISLIFPIFSIMTVYNTILVKMCFLMFMLILLAGLFHEWKEGALDWTN